ncbi:MAG: hypothetical protein J5925_03610 [Clostridia bacterium]|nr:hypothetical protein [Clostridia bacterium]
MRKPFVTLAKNKKTAFAAAFALVLFALFLLFDPGEAAPVFAGGGQSAPSRGLFDFVRGLAG